jgi:hypothetical protein
VPVIFILLLPVAFAASVKDDDQADNFLSFTFNAEDDDLETVASSVRHKEGDDVFFTVTVDEKHGNAPLLGKVRFGLLTDEAVRYDGTMHFRVLDRTGQVAFDKDQPVRFTLRPKGGKRAHNFKIPFDLAQSGDYSLDVTFGR